MTADEKQKLFNLLKTADAWNLGYTRDEFAVTPQFSDDEVINTATAEPVSVPSELTKPAESVSVSSEPINNLFNVKVNKADINDEYKVKLFIKRDNSWEIACELFDNGEYGNT